jgi:hypothetical protein
MMKLGGAVIYALALTASTVLFTPCLGDYLSNDNVTHCLFEIAEIDSCPPSAPLTLPTQRPSTEACSDFSFFSKRKQTQQSYIYNNQSLALLPQDRPLEAFF